MNLEKHIYEGWTVKDFIKKLEPMFDMIIKNQSHIEPFKSQDEIKEWCMDNQPYYKKHIPEVYSYFKSKYNERSKSSKIN